MAIVLSENICLFTHLKLQKAHKVERGARALYPDERLKDETDLSGISWALGTQCMAATLSGLFPLQLWAMLTSQRLKSKHLSFCTKTQTYICPKPVLLYYTHTHSKHFCLYICKETSPVWYHSTTAGYGSKKRQQISVDYINTKVESTVLAVLSFNRNWITITLWPVPLKEHADPNSLKVGLNEKHLCYNFPRKQDMKWKHDVDKCFFGEWPPKMT